jgi:AcrR family transcriptional regulator
MEVPLRADARDNRARILAAAEDVFGAGGETASTEDVARLAGVGIATVFRHFPTKQELLYAVLTARLEALRDRARELATAHEPGAALRSFITEVVTTAPSKLAIAGALSETGPSPAQPGGQLAGAELKEAFGQLLERAQQAGAVRPDVAAPEVYALMIGASRATAYDRLDDAVRDRMLAVIFDGLRPVSGAG